MVEITVEYLASQGLSKSFTKRFWDKVNKTETCWLWNGAFQRRGYGCINRGGRGGVIIASRGSWIIHYGPIPHGMCVLHKCDNPPCVNPDHLFLGTRRDNTDDKIRKGRQLRGEQIGTHKLTERQVLEIRRLWDTGDYTMQEIADEYGVCIAAMFKVIRLKTWAHCFPNTVPVLGLPGTT